MAARLSLCRILLGFLALLSLAIAQSSATTSATASATTSTTPSLVIAVQSTTTTPSVESSSSTQASTSSQTLALVTPAFPSSSVYFDLDPSLLSVSRSITILNATDYDAFCWYPVSGNYGRLPRILFYVTIVFALVARTHTWLIAGALASAFAYSGTAAIHACLLVWHGPGTGELDIVGLLAILSTSCLITVPLLNWSSTIRNLDIHRDGVERTRTIIVYWGFLITVGFLCVFVSTKDNNVTAFGLWNYSGLDEIQCAPTGGQLNTTAGQNVDWGTFVITAEWISENNCVNPCSTPFYPGAIFRTDSDLQTLTVEQINEFVTGTGLSNNRRRAEVFVSAYLTYALCLLPYILAQGIFAACFRQRTPGQVRNLLYLIFHDVRLPFVGKAGRPMQAWLAKVCATLIYLWAVVMAVLCPPLFIVNLVAVELFINPLPESENHTHVGAWGPWASTALVLFAAFVARYHADIVDGAVRIINEIFWWTGHLWRGFRRWEANFSGNYYRYARPATKGRQKSQAPDPDVLKKTQNSAFNEVKRVLGRGWERVIAALMLPLDEWRDFIDFWRHPENVRYQKEDDGMTVPLREQERTAPAGFNRTKNGGYEEISTLPPVHKSQRVRERLKPTLLPGGDRVEAMIDRLGIVHHIIPETAAPPPSLSSLPTQPVTSGTDSAIKRRSMAPLPPLPPDITRKPVPTTTFNKTFYADDEYDDDYLSPNAGADTEDRYGLHGATGLTQSLEDSRSARRRRSAQAYTPEISPHGDVHPLQRAISPYTDATPTQESPEITFDIPLHPRLRRSPSRTPNRSRSRSRSSSRSGSSERPAELSPQMTFEPTSGPLIAEDEWQILLENGASSGTPLISLSPQPDLEVHHGSPNAPMSHPRLSQASTFPASMSPTSPFGASGSQHRPSLVPRAQAFRSPPEFVAQGQRSTVSYLQVQRPATMMFQDEIRLRKDEYGVYHVVEEGQQF